MQVETSEPRFRVRTIHHLSCSGGTLFSKCVAVCGAPLFISEINPLNRRSRPVFSPMDIVSQLETQYRLMTLEEKTSLFEAQMQILEQIAHRTARPVCIRDHTHSSFLGKKPATVSETHMLLKQGGYDCLSVATIRHPLDAFAGMRKAGWSGGVGDSLETYCARVLSFMEYCDAEGIGLWRYEDFCLDPSQIMQEICEMLDLSFNPNFLQDFPKITLTGDSGRSSPQISLRSRRPVSEALRAEAQASRSYAAVCDALGYSASCDAPALSGPMKPAPAHAPRTRDLARGAPFTLTTVHPSDPGQSVVTPKTPFFFHTADGDAAPSITLDLQRCATLFSIIITNRKDKLPGRAVDLVAVFHDAPDPATGREIAISNDDDFLVGRSAERRIALDGVTARYVTIASKSSTMLHFSDLRIIGRAAT